LFHILLKRRQANLVVDNLSPGETFLSSRKMEKIALGFDLGTENVNALLVEPKGGERGRAVKAYAHGQITRKLPTSGPDLLRDFALQAPQDWIDAAVVREALRSVKLWRRDIIGIGVDFRNCTMLPTLADGRHCARWQNSRARNMRGRNCGNIMGLDHRPIRSDRSTRIA